METDPRYEAAVAYVGCDGTGVSAKAIASKYCTEAAVLLCAPYKRATEGRCSLSRPPQELSGFDIYICRRWKSLGHMEPINAKKLFVRLLEMIDPEWTGVDPITETVVNGNVSESDAPQNVELETAQDKWLRIIMAIKIEIPDCTSERTIEDSRRQEIDCVQLAINDNRKLVEGAIQRYKEARQKGNLVPALIPSINDILKPRQFDEISSYGMGGIFEIDECDCWIAPQVSGQKPKPRYQHGAFELDYKMYVAGGSSDGYWLDDIQVLDLMSFKWSKVDGAENSGLSLPTTPCSGRPLISWNDRLFAIAGHTENIEYITVFELDKCCRTWIKLNTEGSKPIFRCGHSTTLVGNNLVIFGGEDASGNVLNDLHTLNFEAMRWTDVEAIGAAPSRRSDHAAACHEDNVVYIFGGKCHDLYYNDLHKFDLRKSEWTRLDPEGEIPAARAGHAGVTVDANWIIVGGRDCQARFSETFVLNMGEVRWTFLANRLSATEGVSLVASSYDGDTFIVSFGGYDGFYGNEGSCSNEVHVLKLSSTYDRCEPDPWPLSLSEEESETLILFLDPSDDEADTMFLSESKRRKQLEALVSKRIKEQKALISKRKEELEALVSKRKKELKALALVPKRKEELASWKEEIASPDIVEPYIVEKEVATPRKRKLSLFLEAREADVSESAEKSCTPKSSESESTEKSCASGNSESESTEKSCTSGNSESESTEKSCTPGNSES